MLLKPFPLFSQALILRICMCAALLCFAPVLQAQVEEKADSTEYEEEEEEAPEYDTIISENGPYWDYIRPNEFNFDTNFAPARSVYPIWDTVVVNPYKVDLKDMNDTISILLSGFDDCAFHPPAIGDKTSDFGFRRWGRRAKPE